MEYAWDLFLALLMPLLGLGAEALKKTRMDSPENVVKSNKRYTFVETAFDSKLGLAA